MSMSGQWFIASTEGTGCTLYASMRSMGIELSPQQAQCQATLEAMYPPIIDQSRDVDTQVKEWRQLCLRNTTTKN
jgi:hypothetical protein